MYVYPKKHCIFDISVVNVKHANHVKVSVCIQTGTSLHLERTFCVWALGQQDCSVIVMSSGLVSG